MGSMHGCVCVGALGSPRTYISFYVRMVKRDTGIRLGGRVPGRSYWEGGTQSHCRHRVVKYYYRIPLALCIWSTCTIMNYSLSWYEKQKKKSETLGHTG